MAIPTPAYQFPFREDNLLGYWDWDWEAEKGDAVEALFLFRILSFYLFFIHTKNISYS